MSVFDNTYDIVPRIGDLYSIQIEMYPSQLPRINSTNINRIVNNILMAEYGHNIKCSLVGAVDKYLMPEILRFERSHDSKIEIEEKGYGYVMCVRGYSGYLYARVFAIERVPIVKAF